MLAATVTVLGPPGQPLNAQQLILPGATVNILWHAPSRQSLSIQRQLNFMGTVTADSTTETDGRSPALIALLSGPVSLERLAATLLTTYTQEGYGGIVLQRGSTGQLLISHQTSLPDGTIHINNGPLGITTLNARSKPGKDALLQAMEPLLK
ncbi:MAG: hypothetical protein FJ083_09075 [Cyanobacteria bacterium K_Offshore_surface_m2_239]|nr:hypothetical protein [Cyanobacteria bacterium K_Offshore_surface_m2_239]